MAKRWRVEGFDGTECICRADHAATKFSKKQVQQLLTHLAARSLTFSEIAEAPGRDPSGLLEVQVENGNERLFEAGSNPDFIARLEEG